MSRLWTQQLSSFGGSDAGDDDLGPLLAESGQCKEQQFYGAMPSGPIRWGKEALQWWQRVTIVLLLCFIGVSLWSKVGAGSGPQCMSLKYPQCESAIKWYLANGASSRCQAFERVKAEGDFFQFPNSPDKNDYCTNEGCCDCPGQCSKCPPILSECLSWRLDGQWKVAFTDGAEATYNFDAMGHLEMKLPPSELPRMFHDVPEARAPAGNDLLNPAQWLTAAEAKELCVKTAGCQAATWDTSIVKTGVGCWKLGVSQGGPEMISHRVKIVGGPRACNAHCKAVKGCKRWTLQSNQTCQLFASELVVSLLEKGATSGSPDCLDDCACSSTTVNRSGQCKAMAADLGVDHKTPEACVDAAYGNPACGDEIMWAPVYNKQWGCRCCAQGSGFTANPNWQVRSCASRTCKSPVAHKLGPTAADENYLVYLKSAPALDLVPGSQWQSIVEQPKAILLSGAAVAGPIVIAGAEPTAFGAGGWQAFSFDLHRAAPDLFPKGSRELLTLQDGELYVQRGSVKGTGVLVKQP